MIISNIWTHEAQTACFPFDEFLKYYAVRKLGQKLGIPKNFEQIVSLVLEPSQYKNV